MFRGVTSCCHVRVLCLTVVPDGGAMTLALKTLGYTPYTLRSVFQHGHAKQHPIIWSALLNSYNHNQSQLEPPVRKQQRRQQQQREGEEEEEGVDMRLFSDYDAIVGPPAVVLYDRVLQECPEYTKVILVTQEDKSEWVQDYETHVLPLLQKTHRFSRHRIAEAFHNMTRKMLPHDGDNIWTTGTTRERVAALERYEAQVRGGVPKSRLLVYRYGDGWEPLCAFLERDMPANVSFPPYDSGVRVIGNLQERIERTEKLTYVLLLVLCGSVVYGVYPALDPVCNFAGELYRDYQTAYGTA